MGAKEKGDYKDRNLHDLGLYEAKKGEIGESFCEVTEDFKMN